MLGAYASLPGNAQAQAAAAVATLSAVAAAESLARAELSDGATPLARLLGPRHAPAASVLPSPTGSWSRDLLASLPVVGDTLLRRRAAALRYFDAQERAATARPLLSCGLSKGMPSLSLGSPSVAAVEELLRASGSDAQQPAILRAYKPPKNKPLSKLERLCGWLCTPELPQVEEWGVVRDLAWWAVHLASTRGQPPMEPAAVFDGGAARPVWELSACDGACAHARARKRRLPVRTSQRCPRSGRSRRHRRRPRRQTRASRLPRPRR